MNLKSFIDEEGIKADKLAEMVGGVTGAAVRLWLAGARMPSAEAIEKIFEITGGRVTIVDLHESRMAFIRANPTEPKPTEAGEAA